MFFWNFKKRSHFLWNNHWNNLPLPIWPTHSRSSLCMLIWIVMRTEVINLTWFTVQPHMNARFWIQLNSPPCEKPNIIALLFSPIKQHPLSHGQPTLSDLKTHFFGEIPETKVIHRVRSTRSLLNSHKLKVLKRSLKHLLLQAFTLPGGYDHRKKLCPLWCHREPMLEKNSPVGSVLTSLKSIHFYISILQQPLVMSKSIIHNNNNTLD